METQSQQAAPMTRLEAARQAVLGGLARAKETLQVAATTVPAWARDVELKAGEQADALLERVGLVRIAKVQAKPEKAVEAVAVEAPAESDTAPAEAVEAVAVEAAPAAESTEGAESVEGTEAPEAAETTEAPGAQSPGAGHDRGGRRRRR